MIGIGLMLACGAAAVVLCLRACRAYGWRHRGVGERQARVEYARMHRDGVDTAEARLSEAEFIRYRVASRPGASRYVAAALAMVLMGLFAFWGLMAGWPWG
ncbi:MAG: hypothetical protein EPN38_08390 [Rhodanobacteraceae bacterium]|nr:MAG: hypothetical protein EPN38_08390 [Rhodanobacteraceae bacterium]